MIAINNYISNIDPDISIHQLRDLVSQYPFSQAYRVFLAAKSGNDSDCVHAALFGNPFINQSRVQFVKSELLTVRNYADDTSNQKNEVIETIPNWIEEELTEDVVEKIEIDDTVSNVSIVDEGSIGIQPEESVDVELNVEEVLVKPVIEQEEADEATTPILEKKMVLEEYQRVETMPIISKKSGKKGYKNLEKLLTDEELSDFVKWLLQQKPLEEAKFLKIKHKFGKKQKKSAVALEAEKSVQKSEQVASESLAKLLASQGHTEDAVSMYKQLSLLYPEKSVYFAVQIENLINNR